MKKVRHVIITAVVATMFALFNPLFDAKAETQVPTGYTGSPETYEEMNVADTGEDAEAELAALSVNSTNVSLYVLDETYADKISIPSSYNSKFQINAKGMSGKVTYSVISGDSVTVSSTGLIEPAVTIWYWSGGFASSWPMEGAEMTKEYNTGKSVVQVSDSSHSVNITVNVIDYSQTYVENVEKTFVKNNIKASMTDFEKLKAITEYVAHTYNYSANYSSARGMVISGGGDCWASCDLIMDLCNMVDLENHIRIANQDAGAGSGHRNVVVRCDGKLYIADAGYDGVAPRTYDLYEAGEFSVSGTTVYQYNGFDTSIVIPSGITAIGEPGENVFYYAYTQDSITSISIPKTVTSISNVAFAGLEKLTSLKVDSGNAVFKSIDGCIYSKDGTKLYTVPNGKKTASIAKGTETIGEYAFYYNTNISSITIPDTVTTIEEGAFGDCSSLSRVVVPSSVESLADYAFYSSVSTLVVLADDVEFGKNVVSSEATIVGYAGSTAATYAKNNKLTFIALDSEGHYVGTSGKNTCILDASGNIVKKTCLRNVDGTLKYFKNGVINKSKAIVTYNGKKYYVRNAVICKDKTLVKYNGKYYYVKNGTVCKDKTLVKYNGKYYYVKNGTVCKDKTLVKYNGKYYYVKNGNICRDKTLVKYSGKYYYVKNGTVCKSRALVKYNKKYYYVKNGTICKVTAIVTLNKNKYYIKKGVWKNKTSAILKCGKKTYYIKNGKVNVKYTGRKSYKGHTYYVKKGVVTKKIK